MIIAITGANGFIGKALTQQILRSNTNGEIRLADVSFTDAPQLTDRANVQRIEGDLCDKSTRLQLLKTGVDVLFHLAALPGGSAEANPERSKRINLEATLALLEEAARESDSPKPTRVVNASTIAVFGDTLPNEVDDSLSVAPSMTYGTHKAMVELAIADMTRRKQIDGVSLRLPGVVARSQTAHGLKSAFVSDVFYSLLSHSPFTSPVSGDATVWINSVASCANNLLQISQYDLGKLTTQRTLNLPVIRCSVRELYSEIAKQTGAPESLIQYSPDAELERLFGRLPRIKTRAAEGLGLKADSGLKQLVERTLNSIHSTLNGPK